MTINGLPAAPVPEGYSYYVVRVDYLDEEYDIFYTSDPSKVYVWNTSGYGFDGPWYTVSFESVANGTATWRYSGIPNIGVIGVAEKYPIIWANFDVRYQDGTTYLPDQTIKVTGITLLAPDSVPRGGLPITISATVTGEGEFDNTCTATMSGAEVSNTILDRISGNIWRLYCSSEETASEITVTVTSDADSTISASKTISVVGDSDSGDDTGGDSGDSGGDSGGGSGGTGGGITPEGTLEITENGIYDVTQYAEVNVNVQATEEIKAAFMSGLATGLALYSIGV